MPSLHISQRVDADRLLSIDPFALLVGMVLDQQIPIERAFAAPFQLTQRLGVTTLDASSLAATDSAQLREAFATKPALHRFPGAMADRVHELATVIHKEYDGDAANIWRGVTSADELYARLRVLPGFGERKAKIFVAFLGKQLRVRPVGWREAAGNYGEVDVFYSVADVTGPESLKRLREYKRTLRMASAKNPGRP